MTMAMVALGQETPAQEVGLAVGLLSAAEAALFKPSPFNPRFSQDYDRDKMAVFESWRENTLALTDNWGAVHDAMAKRCKPIKAFEPNCDGQFSRQLGDMLRPIGAKMAPHLSGEQATAWRKAMVMALSDLPPDIAINATQSAIHVPMQFLSEVETNIRKCAKDTITKMQVALGRLAELKPDLPSIPFNRHAMLHDEPSNHAEYLASKKYVPVC